MASEPQVRVKLTSARAGHSYDSQGRFTGVFSQAAGDIVSMPKPEAERHFEKGLAVPTPEEPKGR
jgi:hypothetical protein